MKKWVWHITLAAASALGALFVACSSSDGLGGGTAGSSFETENSVAMTILLADGSPAARTKVLVRPNDFLAGSSSRYANSSVEADTIVGIYNKETDDQGQLTLARMKAGDYVIEARGNSEKAFARLTVKDSVCDTLSMALAKVGSMKGQVIMPEGVSSVSVGIRGLDYVVQTDSLGNFEFPSLPQGSFNTVGFIYSTYDYVDVNGKVDVVENFQALGIAPVKVESEKPLEDVTIGSRPQPSVPQDTLPADTTETDTVPEDTVEVYPYLLLDDFEDSTYGWYSSVSRNATVELTSKSVAKFGLVASLQCSKDSAIVWTMMGHNFSKFYDFSGLDSVVLWARGLSSDSDSMWVSVSFDVHVDNSTADSLLGYETGKAWAHYKLDGQEWTRVVVVPDDLVPADSNKVGGNLGWDAVKDHINSLGIFAGSQEIGEYELQVDDVEIFGVKGLAP